MFDRILNASWWQYQFLSNTLQDYLVFVAVLVVLLIIFKILQVIIITKLNVLAQKTKTNVDDTLIEIVKSLQPPFYFFLAIYLSLFFLVINPIGQKMIDAVLIIWVTYQAIIAIQVLINYLINKKLPKDSETQNAVKYFGIISKLILWSIGVILILSNLGVNITSLVAGLGIGGIALALALQNILEDLFSSLAIYFDKPFQVGDFIVIGEHKGIVEKIGIKTTRIRALQGEQLVISNKELTSSRIQNFKKLEERRATFNLGVVYDTPNDKLIKIPEIIKEIIEAQELTRFDRAHFGRFADSALVFDIVYYILSNEYNVYMEINQKILLAIKQAFERENISMAYPTQTINLIKENPA